MPSILLQMRVLGGASVFAEGVDFDMGFTDKYPAVADGYTGFRLYGLWIYGLFGFISVIRSIIF